METGIVKHISAFSAVLGALCYCFFISPRIPNGFFRLISLLPIFFLFTILPLYIPSLFFSSVLAFFISWLANFKLILFAFGQGPLSSAQSSNSLTLFIAYAALPIRTKPDINYPSSQLTTKPAKKLPILNNLGAETLACAILIGSLAHCKETLHPKMLLVGYCCMVFLAVDCLVACSSFLVHALVGLELEPPSDEPYLSTSLQEFWGRRWNLAVTETLRQTVYKPAKSALAVLLGNDNELASLPAVWATFLVSGLMHELIYFYMTREKPTWEATSFFALHGTCVVLEFVMKKALNGRLDLPWFVSGPLTVGFVISTAVWLFFPPFTRTGADTTVFEEFQSFVHSVQNGLLLLTRLVEFWH